jgi:hypothetical protein
MQKDGNCQHLPSSCGSGLGLSSERTQGGTLSSAFSCDAVEFKKVTKNMLKMKVDKLQHLPPISLSRAYNQTFSIDDEQNFEDISVKSGTSFKIGTLDMERDYSPFQLVNGRRTSRLHSMKDDAGQRGKGINKNVYINLNKLNNNNSSNRSTTTTTINYNNLNKFNNNKVSAGTTTASNNKNKNKNTIKLILTIVTATIIII